MQSHSLSEVAGDLAVSPKSSQVICITHGRLQSSCEGHVHVEAHTCSTAHLQHTLKQDFTLKCTLTLSA